MGIGDWSINRRSAQPFLEGLGKTDLSGSAILSFLTDQGLGYRRGDFFEDMRRIRGTLTNQPNVARLRADSFIPTQWITESPLDHANRYRYDFKSTFRDPATGAIFEKDRSMTYDQYLTKGEAEEMFDTEPDWGISEPDMEYVSSQLVSLLHREGDPFP